MIVDRKVLIEIFYESLTCFTSNWNRLFQLYLYFPGFTAVFMILKVLRFYFLIYVS